MEVKLTYAVRRLLAALCVAASPACTGGSDPDPRAIVMSSERPPPRRVRDDTPRLVVADSIAPDAMPAAPAGEVALPDAPPPPHHATMLIGHGAAPAIDGDVANVFRGEMVPATDRDAVEWMATDRGDFAVIGGQLSQRDLEAGLTGTRLGVELFALSVPPSSPLRSLSHQQVRQIFTGQLRAWSQLGVTGGDIVPVVPSERAVAERAARALIPGDDFAASCRRVASERHVVDQLLQNPDAIGIVRITGAPREAGQKLLQIDWCPPTLEAFGYGTYPFGMPVTLVTRGAPTGCAQDFAAFTRSAAGRTMLGRTLSLQP